MPKLKKPVIVTTAFDEYTLHEQIGEGGAGRVYGGVDGEGARIAVKVLTQATTDKKRRFKNETKFLASNAHSNIVTVIDQGIANSKEITGPFYVMRRYDASLREQMATKVTPDRALNLFSQMLDGVEAAHLQGVTHRDLKPENFLYDHAANALAVADFGVASFTREQLVTLVNTDPHQRLANFMYAAPEQRARNQPITAAADIYALGLMLNELITGSVPLGTDYRQVAAVAADFGFLDPIVAQMIKQNPAERPNSILNVKQLIQRHRLEAVTLQKLSKITQTVIPAGAVDDPLAHEPPTVVGANFDGSTLTLTLDRPVNNEWVQALYHMNSNWNGVFGIEPQKFSFNGKEAKVHLGYNEHAAQEVVNHFKSWLPKATATHRQRLEERMRENEERERHRLRQEREQEERILRVNKSLKV